MIITTEFQPIRIQHNVRPAFSGGTANLGTGNSTPDKNTSHTHYLPYSAVILFYFFTYIS